MKDVNGSYFLTITTTADEVYHITNTALKKVDILNATDGSVMVSDTAEFAENDGIASYVTIPAGAAANGIYCPSVGIYIKSLSAGDISVMGAA